MGVAVAPSCTAVTPPNVVVVMPDMVVAVVVVIGEEGGKGDVELFNCPMKR